MISLSWSNSRTAFRNLVWTGSYDMVHTIGSYDMVHLIASYHMSHMISSYEYVRLDSGSCLKFHEL